MNWWKKLRKFYHEVSDGHMRLDAHRDDINANTSECAKLLYRLEESELQIKILQTEVKELKERG